MMMTMSLRRKKKKMTRKMIWMLKEMILTHFVWPQEFLPASVLPTESLVSLEVLYPWSITLASFVPQSCVFPSSPSPTCPWPAEAPPFALKAGTCSSPLLSSQDCAACCQNRYQEG